MNIKTWYLLLDQGWTKQLEEAVENLEGEDRLEGELWKILWLGYFHGKYQKAEAEATRFLTNPSMSIRIKIVTHLVIADLMKNKGYGESFSEKLETIQLLFDKLSSLKRKEYRHYEVWFKYLSSCYNAFYVKDFSTAFRILSVAIQYTKEETLSIKYFEPLCLWMRANFHSFNGEYQESIIGYTESIKLYRQLRNDSMNIWALNGLSDVYRHLGDLEKSLELCMEIAEIAKKLDYKEQLRTSFMTLGLLLFIKGDFEEAKSNLEEAMTHIQEKNVDYLHTYSLYIQLLLEMKEYEQVESYLPKFYTLSEELGNQWYPQWIKAIYLKNTGVNFESKAQALKLFRDLSNRTDSNFQMKLIIVFHLIDLLLEEARLLDNPSNMQEVNLLIDQAAEMAQQIPRALIQIFLLQAKIFLIEGKLEESVSLLEEAYTLAKSKKLNLVAEQAKKQQNQLQSELTKWKCIIGSNASLAERVEFTDVKDYLQNAIKLRDLSGSLPDDLTTESTR